MTFDQYIGIRYDEDGAARAWLETEPHHLNPTGNINGGVIMSLADNVATRAANNAYFAKTGEQKFLAGVDMHTAMLTNQGGGTIHAIAEVVRVGRRIVVVRTDVLGDGGTLLATLTTTHVPI